MDVRKNEAPAETSDPVPPPIPEKVHSVGASSLCAPPLPPRTRPPEPKIARNLPQIPAQSAAVPDSKIEEEASTTFQSVAKAERLFESLAVTKTVTLKELSEDPELLPAVIRFVDGYYGQTSSYSLSADEYFQAHFLKHSKVMNIHDTGRNNYTVPLTSRVKFGLLPDVSHCSLSPIPIGTILATKKLPPVACAVTSGKDKKGNCLREGDILIIKEKILKGLKCHNLNTQSDIFIHKSFTGTFTLDPDATRMYPIELAQHLPSAFPCGAKVYHDDQEQDSTLNGKTFTLKGCSTEVCLVATEVGAAGSKKRSLVHFPCHGHLSGLHVNILDVDEKQKQLLNDDAMQLQQTFDPTVGVTYSDMQSDTAVDIQSFLFQDIRADLKNAEMNLVTCAALRQEASGDGQQKEKATADQSAHPVTGFEDRQYELIDSLSLNKRPAVKPRRAQSLASPSVPPLPAPRKQKQLPRQSPSNPAESESDDEYVIIPETQFSTKISPRVPAKPHPRPASMPLVSPPSTHPQQHSFPSKPVVGAYTTLHPPYSSNKQYSIISPLLPQPSSAPPLLLPRRNTIDSEQIKHKNPASRPLVSPPSTHLQQPSFPSKPVVGAYTTLHPPPSSNEQYSIISPQPSSAPPLPLPRRDKLESEQIKDQNRAFLRAMSPVQVFNIPIFIIAAYTDACFPNV